MKSTDIAVIAFMVMFLSGSDEITTLWMTSLLVLSGVVYMFCESFCIAKRIFKYIRSLIG